MSKIYSITYEVAERTDGKFDRVCKDTKNVAAKNLLHAIEKVEKKVKKFAQRWKDESGKQHVTTQTDFNPISAELEIETD